MDNLQGNIFTASQRLNDLTGYSGIEALKREIQKQEENVQVTRRAVKSARAKYSTSVATRSATQREVNDLLQRKHAWTPVDLERFTSLYRNDHANEQDESRAQDELNQAERDAEEASTKLARTILARYHEEQIWSDKIRQMSTWGTWGLMGLNVLLFIVFQIMIEPWRRRRLVKGFEEKVMAALERENSIAIQAAVDGVQAKTGLVQMARPVVKDGAGTAQQTGAPSAECEAAIESVEAAAVSQDPQAPTVQAETTTDPEPELHLEPRSAPRYAVPTPATAFADPASAYAFYQEAFQELFSAKKVVLTQKELTTVALEGAVGGAAVVGLLLVLLRPR